MYSLRCIFLSGILCLLMITGRGQQREPVLPQSVALDQTEIPPQDTFDYVFPSADRPHQLLEHFLSELTKRSVDPLASMQYMETQKAATAVPLYHAGSAKAQRPIWVLLTVFLLFLAIALIRMAFRADFTVIVQAYYDERTLQQVSKEDNMLTSWSYIFLYLVFSLALGLFIVLMESSFKQGEVLQLDNYFRTSFSLLCCLLLRSY